MTQRWPRGSDLGVVVGLADVVAVAAAVGRHRRLATEKRTTTCALVPVSQVTLLPRHQVVGFQIQIDDSVVGIV